MSADPPPPASIRLWLACCRYPAGLLDRRPDDHDGAGYLPGTLGGWLISPSDQSMRRLLELRQRDGLPDLILLVGDQVYIDATAGVFDPALADARYVAPYQQWWQDRTRQAAFGSATLVSVPDDHEFLDDWGPVSPDAQGLDDDGGEASPSHFVNWVLEQGLRHFQSAPLRSQRRAPALLYGPHKVRGQTGRVFLADTRTERTRRCPANVAWATIMSGPQWQAIQDWLQGPAQQGTRFLACGSMVLPRTHRAIGSTPASALHADTWEGYPHPLNTLLAAIHQARPPHLVLLSGDAHLANISRITIRDDSGAAVTVHSIHAPALYAPYPFANAKPADFKLGQHAFEHAGCQYTCDVETWFPLQGNGFVTIEWPIESNGNLPVVVTVAIPGATAQQTPMPDWLASSNALSVSIDTIAPQP